MKNAVKYLSISLLILLGLSACGGGSSVSNISPNANVTPPPPPPPPPVDPDIFRTAEFNANWALEAINAAEAYAKGFTGEGVTIGFVDFNFDLATSELNVDARSLGADADIVAIYEAQIGEEASSSPHGHAVAVTAAGIKNDIDTHGVAFDSNVLLVDFFSGVNSRTIIQNNVTNTLSDPWTWLVNNGARIVNKSLGFDEDDFISNPPQVSQRFIVDFDTNVVFAGGLLVTSGGNNSDNEPSLSNLEALQRLRNAGFLNSGPGAMIMVGAVDKNNVIADFSDHAGSGDSRNHFMVAPGVDVIFPYSNENGPGLFVGSGTSFAAPLVSGAAAVLMERWPSLTARDIRNILFETATDLGEAGVDAVYGHGLLNLNAALSPSGNTTVAVRTVGNSLNVSPLSLAIVSGGAMGDAIRLSDALSNTMITDKFKRDFAVDLSSAITFQNNHIVVGNKLSARQNWQSQNLIQSRNLTVQFGFSYDQHRRAILPFLSQAEQNLEPSPNYSFELAGSKGNLEWRLGRGSSLSASMKNTFDTAGSNRDWSLTDHNSIMPEAQNNNFIIIGTPIGKNDQISFGIAYGQDDSDQLNTQIAVTAERSTLTSSLRYDRYSDNFDLNVSVGLMQEKGSLLGTKTNGAISFGEAAYSEWLSLGVTWHSTAKMQISANVMGVTSQSQHNSTGLIEDVSGLFSSRISFDISYQGLFHQTDQMYFSIFQPLRIEQGYATLVNGAGLNPVTGEILFQAQKVSLAPSGREKAIEAGYSRQFAGWTAEARVAYRFQAGHIINQNDLASLLYLSRRF